MGTNRRSIAVAFVGFVVLVPALATAEPTRYLNLNAGQSWEPRDEPNLGLQNGAESVGRFVELEIPLPVSPAASVIPSASWTRFAGTDESLGCFDCFRVESLDQRAVGLSLRYGGPLSGAFAYVQGGPAYQWQTTELSGGFAGGGDTVRDNAARLQGAVGAAIPLGARLAVGLRLHTYVTESTYGAGLGLSLGLL